MIVKYSRRFLSSASCGGDVSSMVYGIVAILPSIRVTTPRNYVETGDTPPHLVTVRSTALLPDNVTTLSYY